LPNTPEPAEPDPLPAPVPVGDELVPPLGVDFVAVGLAAGELGVVTTADGLAGPEGEPPDAVQAAPLIVQPVGWPEPLTWKPKLTLAPAAIDASQLAGVTVYFWPLLLSVPFHRLATLEPEGRVNATDQVDIAAEVVFVIVYWATYPPSQELVCRYATFGAAAFAPPAMANAVPTAATVAPVPSAASFRVLLLRPGRAGGVGSTAWLPMKTVLQAVQVAQVVQLA
jgi:hypothetical protein